MTYLFSQLEKACSHLGLKTKPQYSLTLGSKEKIDTVMLIEDLGAPRGMLIIKSFNLVENHLQELAKLGYGYSVLSEPRNENEFDLESCREMFRDWGWSGEINDKPTWFRGFGDSDGSA